MNELKECPKCKTQGFYNRDEVRCNDCNTRLIPLVMISAAELAALTAEVERLQRIERGVLICLEYPRGSEAQVRCLEELGQDAAALKAKP
jgi:hypothetical protein